MARVEISEAVQDTAGNALSGASVQVNVRSTGSAATLYEGETGGTTVGNPRTTGTNGRVEAWVDEGSYNLVVSKSGYTSYTQPFEAVVAGTQNPDVILAAPSGSAATDMTNIAAALAQGGRVIAAGGTYLVNAALTQAVTGTIIQGQGMGKTLFQVVAGTTMNGGVFQFSNLNGIEVRDLTIDLNKAGTTDPANEALGMGVYFSSTNATGISRCAVRRVEVKNGHQLGIRASSSSTSNPNDLIIEGCTITGCTKRGIYAERAAGLVVRNNVLSGNNTSDSGGAQIQVTLATGAGDTLIDGNRVVSGSANGIAVSFCENVRIVNNYCASNGSGTPLSAWGIVISEDVKYFTVANNRCLGNYHGGISVDEATSGSEAIKDGHGAIVGNVCSGSTNAHGIYIQYVNGVAIIGNHCFSNAAAGIMLTNGAYRCTVNGNVCRQNTTYGIILTDAGGATADCGEHVVTGNRCQNNTTNFNDNATLRSKYANNFSDASTAVASAATITVPVEHEYVTITGTTNITSVVANATSKTVTLKFNGALTFTDGSNLVLNGNFVTTADDTITLRCDGSAWYEMSRSTN